MRKETMTTRDEGRSVSELVDVPQEQTPAERRLARGVFGALRIVVGWVFLWAFLDKLFGLGYATPAERSWLNGGSPTRGFLSNSATGPFESLYKDIAGAAWADWLFMIGLAGVGVALLLGIGMRVAAVSGALLYLLMWPSRCRRRPTRWWTTTSSAPWSSWRSRSCMPAITSGWAGGGSRSRSSGATPG